VAIISTDFFQVLAEKKRKEEGWREEHARCSTKASSGELRPGKGRRLVVTARRWGGLRSSGNGEATSCGREALWSGRVERRGRMASRWGLQSKGKGREGKGRERMEGKAAAWGTIF
jgi:hypothetical protein